MDRLKESLATQVRDILQVGVPGASEAVVLADFTNEALERLRAKEEEKAADAAGSSQVGAMPADERVARISAKEKYLAYFLEGTGRSPDEGALGAWSPEPAVTPQQLSWTVDDWAKFWLARGGFEPSEQGANTCDVNGWLPLHYALQATVYWSQAHRVVRGLIPMMSKNRLQAKTTGGRPMGWTPLHMAANGSDREMVRAELCQLLLDRRVHVDPEDNEGRTPLHLAAGTGVVDTAQVLVGAGANVHHLDHRQRNCLDKCHSSSGTMKQ
jgi:hypothetical protein